MTSENKDWKVKRRTADRLLSEFIMRVRAYNRMSEQPYRFDSIVVFGSYVNSDKEMLSDIDIGFKLVRKYNGKEFENSEMEAREIVCEQMPSLINIPEYRMTREYALRYIRGRSPYISLHDQQVDQDAIFGKKYVEMDV